VQIVRAGVAEIAVATGAADVRVGVEVIRADADNQPR
jgi:hypothetical protein